MRKSVLAGLLISSVGILFFTLSLPLNAGTLSSIGPAFFPRTISAILVVLGILMCIRNVR